MINIRDMVSSDIPQASRIHRQAFPHDTLSDSDSITWISTKFLGYPVNRYFVASKGNEVIGYILWVEKGGLRNHCVLELEQIGVAPDWRGKGIGTRLINETILEISNCLKTQKRAIKLVEVSTGVSNEVQKLYKDTLGATAACNKRDYYDEDEVVMISHGYSLNECRSRQGYPLLEVG